MLQQGSIALGQGTPFRFLELVGSRREIVGADHLRQPTQGPKRTLQPLLQSFKGLSEGQVHESPPRVAEARIPHLAQTSDAVNRQLSCFSSRYMNLLAVFQI